MPLEAGTVLKEQIVLERELGRGAMGVVWLATHRGLGVQVAVKFLESSQVLSDEARARFDREARAIARVDSIHVVRVSDVGYGPEQQPFIVMEHLRGRDLKDHLEDVGPLSIAETTIIIEQVCDALDRAHAIGVIHRDLKPANIFLVAGPRTFIKVVDFGVAKLDGEAGLALTSTDVLMGTPYYMSPEQFVSPRDVDQRTDLWSVAVIAYACLTGRLPFLGETVGALALAVHSHDFPLPSSLNDSLPASLDAWFQRALQAERDARFASARELAAAFVAAASPGHAPSATNAVPLTVHRPAANSAAFEATEAATSPALMASAPRHALHAPASEATAAATSRTLTGSASLTAPRSRRARWIAAAIVCALAGMAIIARGVISRSSDGVVTSGQPSSSAGPPACEALATRSASAPLDRSAIDECDASCSSGAPGACAALGDLLSKVPLARDDARALSAYRRGCDAKDGRACNGAALLVARGRGTTKSRIDAAELYKRGCDHEDASACSNLAQAYERGSGVVRDPARALALRERGCEGGSMADCTELAALHFTGKGTPKDVARAGALFKRACDGGSLAGCAALAMAHETGQGATQDHRTAVALAKRACNGQEPRGCAALGAIAPSDRTPDEDARSLAFLSAACEALDLDACRVLAWKYQIGYGVLQDNARAASLYRAACDGDDMLACSNLGAMYWHGAGVAQDLPRAVELLRKACEEEGHGCVDLADAYVDGRGVAQDRTIAASLYGGACDRDEPAGCVFLGVLYENGAGVVQDLTRTVSLWEKACTLGEQAGCDGVAAMLLAGRGVARDNARAVRLLQAACDTHFARSCGRLGELYRTGTGVSRDVARARQLFKKACDGGETDACPSAAQVR